MALAVYLNWRLSNGGSQNVTDVYAGGTLGQAVLVDSDSAAEQDYFAKVKGRQGRKQVETAKRTQGNIRGSKTDGESAQKASEQMVKISGYREKENNIETLVKAKGFENCTAVINESSVSVIVKTDGLLQSDMLQIQEIAAGETGYDLANVKIVEIK